MRVGIPREVKNNEYRVAITPAGVNELVRSGHESSSRQDAGVGSSITDAGSWPPAPRSFPAPMRYGKQPT